MLVVFTQVGKGRVGSREPSETNQNHALGVVLIKYLKIQSESCAGCCLDQVLENIENPSDLSAREREVYSSNASIFRGRIRK